MRKPIDPGLSLYFDLVRIIAAIVVVLHHVWPLLFPAFPLPWPGHEAVVVFFVLSGYVIAYSTSDPSMRAATYASHRAARILSVVIPALLLSAAIAPFAEGERIPYAGSMDIEPGQFAFATLVNVVFLGQSFGLSTPPPFNGPFWSICYEVWYYAIFAVWMYSSKRWRIALTALSLAVAGLKIVVLMPIWLLGVWLFHNMPSLTQRAALVLFTVSVSAAFAFYWSGASHVLRALAIDQMPLFMALLHGSNQFIGDTIMGLLVAANFAAVPSLGSYLRPLFRFEKAVRYASSFTLSTYLYHMPLTVLIWNGLDMRDPFIFLSLLGGLILILGAVTERRLHFFRRLVTMPFEQTMVRRSDQLSR